MPLAAMAALYRGAEVSRLVISIFAPPHPLRVIWNVIAKPAAADSRPVNLLLD